MASFLPLVRELSDEYDAQAIAAAALQMVYDKDCPNWMKGDWEVPEVSNKPVLKKKGTRPTRKDRYPNSKSPSRGRTQGKIRSEAIVEQ